jgi:hypothetical protein
MRLASIFLAFLFALGCDPYAEVARTDTIEAYEAYLADNPSGANAFTAEVRLEELYLQKARTEKSLESWDAYLKRWPKGIHIEAAMKEREEFLFSWAESRGDATSWKKFLDEYPTAQRRRMSKAKRAYKAASFAETNLDVSDLRVTKINLAEDPDGPLNGTSFAFDVTYKGDKPLVSMWFAGQFLDKQGKIIDTKEWPLVAPYVEYPVPVEEEKTVPMKSGETRTWDWWADALPEGFDGKVILQPIKVRLADEEE